MQQYQIFLYICIHNNSEPLWKHVVFFVFFAVPEQWWVSFSMARYSSLLDKIHIPGMRNYKLVLLFDWCFSFICLLFVYLSQDFIAISLLIHFLFFCLLPYIVSYNCLSIVGLLVWIIACVCVKLSAGIFKWFRVANMKRLVY